MTSVRFGFAVLSGLVLSSTAALANWNGFCGNYQQTWSNAGDCPTCRLMIADNPNIQFYGVVANNGWEAELYWINGDEGLALGGGQWNNTAGAFEEERFEVEMENRGDRLFMRMTHYNPALGGAVEAEYICLD